MASKFRHHMTCYLRALYVIYVHVETFEDRNPEIVSFWNLSTTVALYNPALYDIFSMFI